MKLKIVYINADTNEILRELELTEEETKALSLDIADIVEFHTNFLLQRVRQNIDKITEEAVKPQSKLLSDKDKRELIKLLLQKEIFVTRPRDLPDEIKRLIVKKADLSVLKPKEEV